MRCCLTQWIRRLDLESNARHWRERAVDFVVSDGHGGSRAEGDVAAVHSAQPLDSVLNLRFSIGRFADVQAVERRDWQCLISSCPGSNTFLDERVREPRYRSPHKRRNRGSLLVFNGYSLGQYPEVLGAVRRALPADEAVAVYYGDDWSWRASHIQAFDAPFTGLACHFAINVNDSAARLPSVRQVPIGLNSQWMAALVHPANISERNVSSDVSDVLVAEGALQSHSKHRSAKLHCCCQRAWPHRLEAYEDLFIAGHTHCTQFALAKRGSIDHLMGQYLRHRFVAAPHGNGRTDFRVWEVLMAGAVPVVDYESAHDRLYAGLPIVRVHDWSEVTPAFLEREWQRIQAEVEAGRLSWTKVYFPYWFAQYTAHISPVDATGSRWADRRT